MFFNLLADKAKWYPLLFDTPHDIVRSVATWLTLALVIAFVICAFALKGDKKSAFIKYGSIFAVAYACVLIITFFTFEFIENKENGEFLAILFVPIAVLIAVIAASGIMLMLKRNKSTYIIAGVLVGAAAVASLVCIGINFASGKGAEMNWITNDSVKSAGLYISVVLLTAAVVVAAFLCDKGCEHGFSTKALSYAAVCIALSFALSYLRVVKMPQGGSITIASLLPLMIYSYMFGTKKGVFAGMIYGLLQAVQDAYILHPAQFLLDYPIAFACIGLSGMFARSKKLEKLPQLQFALGAIVAGLCRFVMHYFSGVFAFGSFAGEQNVWLYSFIYQAGYVLPDIAIVIAVGIFVFSSKSFVKLMRRYNGALA